MKFRNTLAAIAIAALPVAGAGAIASAGPAHATTAVAVTQAAPVSQAGPAHAAVVATGAQAHAYTTTARPAAIAVISICSGFPTCMNFWGGGYNVRTYDGIGVANDNMAIQSLGGGNYQITDRVHGGCIGDGYDSPTVYWAQGGHTCPSTGHASWGTVFRLDYLACQSVGPTFFMLYNVHSGLYVGFATGNNYPVWLNIKQFAAQCVNQYG